VGDGGHHFAAAACRQVSENKVNNRSPHVSERIAVEKQERGPPVTLPEEFYGFVEG
jgi:hypothetical protein